MVARLGDIKRHHFAHDQLKTCTPTYVAQAAARRWLAHQLQDRVTTRQPVTLSWLCPLCKQTHTADLLDGVTVVEQEYPHADLADEGTIDVALLDAAGDLRAAIVFEKPDNGTLAGTMVIVVDVKDLGQRMHDLPSLLSGSTILGGVCTVQQQAAQHGIVTDESTLRRLLVEAVDAPPFHVYGPLTTRNGMTHVLTLGTHHLWLPPILWKQAIGGLHHSINPALQIISQEWPQADGSIIALYYVTARDAHAVAIRRFAPGQPVYARLNTAIFHTARLTATGVAQSFAEV
jgi:hypothetical protein